MSMERTYTDSGQYHKAGKKQTGSRHSVQVALPAPAMVNAFAFLYTAVSLRKKKRPSEYVQIQRLEFM